MKQKPNNTKSFMTTRKLAAFPYQRLLERERIVANWRQICSDERTERCKVDDICRRYLFDWCIHAMLMSSYIPLYTITGHVYNETNFATVVQGTVFQHIAIGPPNDLSVHIDIGSGRGLFCMQRAAITGKGTTIGIELCSKMVQSANTILRHFGTDGFDQKVPH